MSRDSLDKQWIEFQMRQQRQEYRKECIFIELITWGTVTGLGLIAWGIWAWLF